MARGDGGATGSDRGDRGGSLGGDIGGRGERGVSTKLGKLRDSQGNLVTSERANIGRAARARGSAAAGLAGITSPVDPTATFAPAPTPTFSFRQTQLNFSPSFGIDPSGPRAGELAGLAKTARKSVGFFESVREDPTEAALKAVGFAVGFVSPVAGLALSLAATPAERAVDEETGLAGFASGLIDASIQNVSTIAATLTGNPALAAITSFVQPAISERFGFDVEAAERGLVGGVLAGIAAPAIGKIVGRVSNPLAGVAIGAGLGIAADIGISAATKATLAQRGAALSAGASTSGGTLVPSVTAEVLGTTPFRPAPSAPSRFRGVQEEDTISGFIGDTSRQEREALEESLLGPQVSRVDVFDNNFKQINPFGFGTGATLASTEDPTRQFSTRQRTTGGEFQRDSVSFLSRRFV